MNKLFKCSILFLVACSESPTDASYKEETRVIPVGQTFAVSAPSNTNRVDVIIVGPGGQANIFIPGSGGGYVHLKGIPLLRSDTVIAFASRALPRGSDGWLRAAPTILFFQKFGGVIVEAGTAYFDPGSYIIDSGLQSFVYLRGNGQPAAEKTRGCSYLGFGCGADFSLPAADGRIEMRFYRE